MDPAQFLTAPRVTIVAGKGGVGKTTITATMALSAARLGLKALVVEVEGNTRTLGERVARQVYVTRTRAGGGVKPNGNAPEIVKAREIK